jgi:pimeloyl-[acyl-carrier protein] methyl ester esterase
MTTIHREVYGEGRPLVMIHGWAMHSGVWREFAQTLAEYYQVICLDLPGHGRSGAIDTFALPEIGEALLNAIPARKFSLLGWSLGATVAIDMANRFPERVESLLLLAGNPKFVRCDDWPGVKFEVLDAFETLLSNDARLTLMRFLALQVNGLPDGKRLLQLMKHAMRECEPPSVEVLRSGLAILEQSDLRAELQSLQCPVSAILGDRDKLIPLACGLALKTLKPEIKIHMLENAGHVPFLSHAPRLLEILRAIP